MFKEKLELSKKLQEDIYGRTGKASHVSLESGKKILTIEQLHKIWPELTPAGFNYKDRSGKLVYSKNKKVFGDTITDRPREYYAVANFLDKNISKRKTIYKGCSSYHYKHIVENSIHHYVANGMLIAAAIACGYKMHYNNFCGPNAFFAWSIKDWDPFEYHNNRGHSGPPLDEEWTKEKSERLEKLFGPNAPVRVSKEWEYLHKKGDRKI
jgi:hypothetical protein|tara:strand:+ start:32 stop:661 length:630 start_codon:yes stop_codon:yes gene_type:complete